MYKSIETTGKTEEEAINAALTLLGLERDEISVEVLERAKPGFLGIGATPARIRVYYKVEDDAVVRTREFLEGLLVRMGSDAKVEVTPKDETTILVNLTGNNIGPLIGRRGETLDAIQHLTNFVVNRAGGTHIKITIDAEDYRKKREQALVALARKMAGKVVKYRRNMTLEPMNSYERHVIHSSLQDFEGVTTYSVGTEPNRRVVIAYAKPRTARHDFRSKR